MMNYLILLLSLMLLINRLFASPPDESFGLIDLAKTESTPYLTRIETPLLHNRWNASKYHYKGSHSFRQSLGYTSGVYTTTVLVGGQQTPMNVHIDTGSSTFSIYSARCVGCGTPVYQYTASVYAQPVACRTAFCVSCDTTYSTFCAFSVSYGDGSSQSGGYITDRVTVGGLTAVMPVGLISSANGGSLASFEPLTVSGIIGLAAPSLNCNPNCQPTVIQSLVQSGKMSSDIFGMCFTSTYGCWDLGSPNRSQYTTITYLPMVNYLGFYAVLLESISVGTSKTVIPSTTYTIWDSGTTLIVVPYSIWSWFSSLVRTAPYGSTLLSDLCAPLTRSQIQSWPNLTFTFGSALTTLSPIYYLTYCSPGYVSLGISQGNNGLIILGDTFLQSIYSVYDRANNRVGIGTLISCQCPTPTFTPTSIPTTTPTFTPTTAPTSTPTTVPTSTPVIIPTSTPAPTPTPMCNSTQYRQNNTCVRCNTVIPSCLQCLGQTQCSLCESSLWVSNGFCCPPATYYQKTCVTCPLNCLSCSSGNSCNVCNEQNGALTTFNTVTNQCSLSSNVTEIIPITISFKLQTDIVIAMSNSWQTKVCQTISVAVSINPSRCQIVNIVAGSVIATVQINPETNSTSPATVVVLLSRQLQNTTSIFVTLMANVSAVDTTYIPIVQHAILCPDGTYSYLCATITGSSSINMYIIYGVSSLIGLASIGMCIHKCSQRCGKPVSTNHPPPIIELTQSRRYETDTSHKYLWDVVSRTSPPAYS